MADQPQRSRHRRAATAPPPEASSGGDSASLQKQQAKALALGATRSTTPRDDQKATFQRRLWRYLFNNVNRAVDELYNLCEDDMNMKGAQEATALLQRCTSDFEKLVERIERQAAFARTPTRGLEWEVRKTNLGQPAEAVRSQVERIDDLPGNSDEEDIGDGGNGSDDREEGDVPALKPANGSPASNRPKSLTLQLLEAGSSPGREDGDIADAEDALVVESSEEFSDGLTSTHQLHSMPSHHNRHISSASSLFSVLSGDDDDAVRFAEGSDAIWAQAEAFVEAEAQAEEAAWLQLQLDLEMVKQGGHMSVPAAFPLSPYSTESMYSAASSTTSAYRSLHEKLMSPDRRKLTPVEAKKRHEERQQAAELNRERYEHERLEKARQTASRVKDVEQRKAQRQAQAEQQMVERLSLAEKRHDEYIKAIRGKAGNENIKVNEVLFINSLNKEVVQMTLQEQLAELEARIQAGRVRRQQRLLGIAATQRGRHQSKVKQMSQRQLEQEKLNMERWNRLSARIEAVTERREQRLQELQKQHDLLLQQQQAAKERREALQQEIIAKAQLKEQRRNEAAARRAAKAHSSGSPSAGDAEKAESAQKAAKTDIEHVPSPRHDNQDVGSQGLSQRLWKDALAAVQQATSRKVTKKAREAFLAQRAATVVSQATAPPVAGRDLADGKLLSHVAELQRVLATASQPAVAKQGPAKENDDEKGEEKEEHDAQSNADAEKITKKQKGKKRKKAASSAQANSNRAGGGGGEGGVAAAVASAAGPLLATLENAPADSLHLYLQAEGVLDVLGQLIEPADALSDWFATPTNTQLFKLLTKLVHQPRARDAVIGHPVALNIIHAFMLYSRAVSLWWSEWLASIEAQEQLHGKSTKPAAAKKHTDQLPPCLECASELIAMLSLLVRHIPGDTCTTYQEFIWYLHSAGIIQALLGLLRKTHEHTARLLESPMLRMTVGRAYALLEAASTVLASHSHSADAAVKSLQQLRGRACSFPRAAEIFVTIKEAGFASNILSSLGSLLMDHNPSKHNDEYHLNPYAIELATVALRALNNIALSDLRIAQDLSVEDVQITLFHVVERILAVITPLLGNQRSRSEAEECLRQLIVYLGYLSLGQPLIQQRLSCGRPPTVLMRLCSLPMRFFSDNSDKAVLLPTLIASVHANDVNKRILLGELSPALLVGYLEKHQRVLDKCTAEQLPVPAETRALSLRLPSGMWGEVIRFLQAPVALEASGSDEH